MRYFFPVVFVLSFNILYGQILAESGNSAVTIEELIRKSEEAANSNLDSALYYSKKADILIAKMPENIEKVEVYRNLGSIYLAKANFVNASEYTLLATKINDKLYQSDSGNSKLAENKIRLITQLGNISLYQNNFDEAYAIYNKASTLLEKEKAIPAQQVNAIKVKILNNIAAGYSKQRQFRKARGYFETAMKINEKLNDPSLEASLLNNIGICHLEENEFTLAIYYFEQALEIRKKSNDSRGIAQCYNNLGKVYALSDNMEKAGIYFNDALVLGKQIGNIESIIYTLESQTALYEKIKDFQKAFYSQSQLSKLKDSLFNTE
ncbi:MAG: tetratricopeptide repeat protein, partial [Chryseobacterium sp.]|nr:tetratricopeptide repeat protein [Chryseobacterium sp.]